MPPKQRIVIYGAGRRAVDDELVDAIVAATSVDRAALAGQLAKNPAVYLPELDPEDAAGLLDLLARRGLDHDVDSFPPPPEKVAWLEREIPKWVKRGFLPSSAQPGLYWNYGLTAPEAGAAASPARPAAAGRDPGLLVKAVLTIGAILVGLGLILFIASNWQRIPAGVKIGGALTLSLAALHLGHQLRFVRGPYPKLSATSFILALFGIGGVVTLIAQIYHLQAGTHVLPLVWGALCLPVASLLRFRPALYFASGLWLWSYWLYPMEHDRLPWYYAALLLGLLLPWAIAAGDRALYWTHVALVLVALASTVATDDFWLSTLWLAGLAALAFRDRRPLFDWLLAAGFFIWQLNFLEAYFEEVPNALYLAPLAWFFHRAWRRKDDWFLLATVANALFWWFTFVLQLGERFDLGEPAATGVLLWALATGVLVYGFGCWLAGPQWRPAATLLRAGGAALALTAVYALSFRFYAGELGFFRSSILLPVSLASFALGGALAARRGAAAGEPSRGGELLLLALSALALVLAAALPPALALHVVLFNLILFVAALLSMLEGHRRHSLLWYNLGIGLFVVLIGSRYFDTFVDLLPRSVFFLGGGFFLIVWAVFADRQRRRRAARRGEAGG